MPVLLTGHLSVREEEDTKLLVDVVEPLVQLPPPEEPMSDIERAKRSPVKLYLRMQRSQMDEVKEVLQRQPGKVPVYMNFPDEGITLPCPRDWWVRGRGGHAGHADDHPARKRYEGCG